MSNAHERAFDIYRALGPDRSLAVVAQKCKQLGLPCSIATLKRWSTKYGWVSAASQHPSETDALPDELPSDQGLVIMTDLDAIRILKERFKARVLLDPRDPSLSPAQRRRALDIGFREFSEVLRMEREMAGKAESKDANAFDECAPQSGLLSMLDEAIRLKYKLPAPDQEEPIGF